MSRGRRLAGKLGLFLVGAVVGAPTGFVVYFVTLALAGLLFWPHDVGGGFIMMILSPIAIAVGAVLGGALAVLLSLDGRRIMLSASIGLLAGAFAGYMADLFGPMSMNAHLWVASILAVAGTALGVLVGMRWNRRFEDDPADTDAPRDARDVPLTTDTDADAT